MSSKIRSGDTVGNILHVPFMCSHLKETKLWLISTDDDSFRKATLRNAWGKEATDLQKLQQAGKGSSRILTKIIASERFLMTSIFVS